MTSYHGWTHTAKRLGGTDPINQALLHIKVFADDESVSTGDGAFIFAIAEDMAGLSLRLVEMFVTTASSSGIVQTQLRNVTQAVDMLSTRVQIDANELHSDDAATGYVIAAANARVAFKDQIAIDIDQAGTGAQGLGVILWFA